MNRDICYFVEDDLIDAEIKMYYGWINNYLEKCVAIIPKYTKILITDKHRIIMENIKKTFLDISCGRTYCAYYDEYGINIMYYYNMNSKQFWNSQHIRDLNYKQLIKYKDKIKDFPKLTHELRNLRLILYTVDIFNWDLKVYITRIIREYKDDLSKNKLVICDRLRSLFLTDLLKKNVSFKDIFTIVSTNYNDNFLQMFIDIKKLYDKYL